MKTIAAVVLTTLAVAASVSALSLRGGEHVAPSPALALPHIKMFHVHWYFFKDTKKSYDDAMASREKFMQQFPEVPCFDKPTIGPDGPHIYSQWECHPSLERYGEILIFIQLNHDEDASVLIHTMTGESTLNDHTIWAGWFGQHLPLDTSYLKPHAPVSSLPAAMPTPVTAPRLVPAQAKYTAEEAREIALRDEKGTFDIHFYFYAWDHKAAEDALQIRKDFMAAFPHISCDEPHFGPIGPHPTPMWECNPQNAKELGETVPFIHLANKGYTVLVHPHTGKGEVYDHTVGAFWFNQKLQLDFSKL